MPTPMHILKEVVEGTLCGSVFEAAMQRYVGHGCVFCHCAHALHVCGGLTEDVGLNRKKKNQKLTRLYTVHSQKLEASARDLV